MYLFAQFPALFVSAATLVGSVTAAPLNVDKSRGLVARGRGGTHIGWATYYNPSEGRGACGWENGDYEHVVAISQSLWDQQADGNGSSYACGRTATVGWQGRRVKVRIVDICPVCGYNDLDMSPSAFEQLGDKSIGRLQGVKWKFD